MNEFQKLERRTYRAARDDGLWDVMLAAVLMTFAIGPLLSASLGDFWSAAVFLPVWTMVFLAIKATRRYVVEPRVGTIQIGAERRESMRQAGIVLLAVNAIALVGGVVAWVGFGEEWFDVGGMAYPIGLAVVALVGGSAVAVVTGIWRYALYGLLVAAAPLVGEWLWQNGLADHHGFPVTFGVVSLLILIIGLGRFASLVRTHPGPEDPAVA